MAKDGEKHDPPLGLDGFRVPPDSDWGLSLEDLGRAYADLLAKGDDPYQAAPEPEPPPGPALPVEIEADQPEEAEATGPDISPRSILEAMLFVGHPENQPLASEKIASYMRGVRPQEIDEMVAELNESYDREGCPYRIESVAGGYRMVLREEFGSLRNKFYGRVKAARLSQAAIDVLAIVAYRQPIAREEVDELRGRPSGSILTQLVRRGLLRMERPGENRRRPLYRTTDRFLALFGLESLDDLPQSPD